MKARRISATVSLVSALLLGIGGCSSPQGVPPPTDSVDTLPSWYLHPPANDDRHFYGVGEGRTLDSAERSALANMARRLEVTVTARTDEHERSHAIDGWEWTNATRKQRIATRTPSIAFRGLATIDSYVTSSGETLLLLSADRERTLGHLRHRIQERLEHFTHDLSQPLSPLHRCRTAHRILEALEGLRSTVRRLIDLSKSDRALLARLERLRSHALRDWKNGYRQSRDVTFTPTSWSTIITPPFKEAGFIPASDAPVRVVADLSSQIHRYEDFTIVRITGEIALYEKKGTPFATLPIDVRGVSSLGSDVAKAKARDATRKRIREWLTKECPTAAANRR